MIRNLSGDNINKVTVPTKSLLDRFSDFCEVKIGKIFSDFRAEVHRCGKFNCSISEPLALINVNK